MEGVGETLKEAGALCDSDQASLLEKIRDLLIDSGLQKEVQQKAVKYARKLPWDRQVKEHYQIAERLVESKQFSI